MSDGEWAILELFGHRQLAGRIAEVDRFGVKMCRIDIPSEPPVTQFYGGSAIYGITITTEEIATKVARRTPPVTHALGLPAPRPPADDIDTGDPAECEDCGATFDPVGSQDRTHPELCTVCNDLFDAADRRIEDAADAAVAAGLDASPLVTTQEEFDALLQREVVRDPNTGRLAFAGPACGHTKLLAGCPDCARWYIDGMEPVTPAVPGLTESTEVYVAAAESLRCPHDCTHTLSEGCPHNCSCRNCEIPF